ncbi:MAG: potassium transporter TrkG [Christensenellales bacterium]
MCSAAELPNYMDALFEAVSGFTTTGATVMTNFDGLPHGVMFWRSFTHWIGGMGVLVLTLALLPQMTGRTSHLVRAESPGPSLSKIVPKIGDTAKILYLIYGALTMVEFALLMVAGMGPYDAAIHAMGTAGTGGFSNYGASVAAFPARVIDVIITVFMVLFGINFALFYRRAHGRLARCPAQRGAALVSGHFPGGHGFDDNGDDAAAVSVLSAGAALWRLSGGQRNVHHGLCHGGLQPVACGGEDGASSC